jgi:hypothetical protein
MNFLSDESMHMYLTATERLHIHKISHVFCFKPLTIKRQYGVHLYIIWHIDQEGPKIFFTILCIHWQWNLTFSCHCWLASIVEVETLLTDSAPSPPPKAFWHAASSDYVLTLCNAWENCGLFKLQPTNSCNVMCYTNHSGMQIHLQNHGSIVKITVYCNARKTCPPDSEGHNLIHCPRNIKFHINKQQI